MDQISGKLEQMEVNNDEIMQDGDDTLPDSLDEFETLYHDLYSADHYRELQKKMMNLPDISKQYE